MVLSRRSGSLLSFSAPIMPQSLDINIVQINHVAASYGFYTSLPITLFRRHYSCVSRSTPRDLLSLQSSHEMWVGLTHTYLWDGPQVVYLLRDGCCGLGSVQADLEIHMQEVYRESSLAEREKERPDGRVKLTYAMLAKQPSPDPCSGARLLYSPTDQPLEAVFSQQGPLVHGSGSSSGHGSARGEGGSVSGLKG